MQVRKKNINALRRFHVLVVLILLLLLSLLLLFHIHYFGRRQ